MGAGLTGGSAFSITAWIALVSMWAGAGVTDLLVDRTTRLAKPRLAEKEAGGLSEAVEPERQEGRVRV